MSRPNPLVFIVACSGFFAMTLNWFDISAGFTSLTQHFHIGGRGVALLVSVFLVGYGVFHIPAGVWVRRYGIRRVVLTGLIAESLAASVTGFAPDLSAVWGLRFVAGAGAALVAGAELALVTVLFPTDHLARAQSVASSAVYGFGALTGLWLWRPLVRHWGAADAFLLAGLVGIGVAGVHWVVLAAGPQRSIPHDTWPALQRVLRQKNLWWIGFGSMGGYGVYFTLSQLGPASVDAAFHVGTSAPWYGGAMLSTGILGAVIGGYWSDVRHTRKWFILGPGLATGAWILIWPHLSGSLALVGFLVTGFLTMLPRPAYTATPGDDRHDIPAHDVATAEGVVFTLLSIGGAVFPVLFSATSATFGGKAGWDMLGLASLVCALFALPMRDVLALQPTPHPASQWVGQRARPPDKRDLARANTARGTDGSPCG